MKINRRNFTRLITFSSVAIAVGSNMPQAMAGAVGKSIETFDMDDLLSGFNNLPKSARPWTYYMWLDGNISREGITHDLEALKRIGIGGILIMNLGLPPNEEIQPGPVRFLTGEWKQLVRHSIQEANRLGLEINMNNDDGWNSGGPWITPEFGMQKLTWSETRVTGPNRFFAGLKPGGVTLDTYKDVAVLAMPAMPVKVIPEPVKTTVEKSSATWIQHDYGKVIEAQTLIVSNQKLKPEYIGPESCELLVSDNGTSFKSVRKFETGWFSFTAPKSVAIRLGNVTGRYFRLLLPDAGIDPADLGLKLEPEALVDHWQMKAGFTYIREHGGGSPLYAMPIEFPKPMPGKFPLMDKVVDLTEKLTVEGSLEWQVPAGEWLILRIGFTPTGMKNGYATPEGRGLDADKYNKKALDIHLAGMIDKVLVEAGPLVGKSMTMLHTDSWESGAANWTASFPHEFKKRRGYDLTRWLAVMAGGRIIDSVEKSERFLWDIRRTIADIFIDNHLTYFREQAHKRGLPFSSESSGRQQFLYDPIAFQVTSDLPMGEFWNTPQEIRPRPDCKGAASAAHVANRAIAGAEAFTQNRNNAGTWLETPFSLKALGDSAFCSGINRYYFHRTVAQPKPKEKPGMTWPKVGINFDTSQTWWENASAWIEYIARCQYLLQLGKFVADVAILTDEGAPSSLTRQLHDPVTPESVYDTSTITESVLRRYNMMPYFPPHGFDYDFISPGALFECKMKDASLVLPHGMSYRILVLPPTRRMTLKLVKKVKELVMDGAIVVGIKPESSPTLNDFEGGDTELKSIATELWGPDDNDDTVSRKIGKGWIFKGNSTQQALKSLQLLPDFECSTTSTKNLDLNIDYIHRRSGSADIYFISNQTQNTVALNCIFRVTGKKPQFWFPDTGKTRDATSYTQENGRTSLPVRLDPAGSMFVIFQDKTTKDGNGRINFPGTQVVQKIGGPWIIDFDPAWGGPHNFPMDQLTPWNLNSDEGVKYYSGTATYRKEIVITEKLLGGAETLLLDLGKVKEIARVKLNGKDLGVLWKPPFQVDIKAVAKIGKNSLEIDVTNLWPNRLIGDLRYPVEKRFSSVNWNPFTADSPLLESGLIGPVTLQSQIV